MNHDPEKAPWMLEHEESNAKNFADIGKTLQEIKDILKPISDTYTAVSFLGKWFTASVVLLSIVVGIITGVMQIFHKQ